MAIEPKITVSKGVISPTTEATPGIASKIAVIGAFNSEVTDLTNCSSKTSAHNIFGTSTSYGTFKGTDAIDFLFLGASSLLVANITTWTTAETPVAETTLTAEKLNSALNKLKHEEFDILFIAEELSDTLQTVVTSWLETEYTAKYCHGQVAQLQKQTTSAYETSIATFTDNIYWIQTQTLKYLGENLDLNRSAAYMCGLIAGTMVNQSLTAKIIPGVTQITPEYLTTTGQIGEKLLQLNVPFLKCRNRSTKTHYCVNSLLPNGLDLYINRVRDYIINRIAVETFLGEIGSDKTLEGISNVVENIRYQCVDVLGLLKDFEYHVEEESASCVNVVLERLVFDDVITEIKITYNIEVE